MAEIKISYSARVKGQVGPRPQKIHLNEVCRVTCAEEGALTIEFLDGSPLERGTTRINKDEDFVVTRPGRFRFKCVLTLPGRKPMVVGDPDDPNSVPGGEIEVGTEPAPS